MNNIIDPIDTRVVFYSVRTAVYVCCSPATTAQVFLPRISGGGASLGKRKEKSSPFLGSSFLPAPLSWGSQRDGANATRH